MVSDFGHWDVALEGDDVSSLGADGVVIGIVEGSITDDGIIDDGIVDWESSDAWQSRDQQECEMFEPGHVCCCLKESVMQM